MKFRKPYESFEIPGYQQEIEVMTYKKLKKEDTFLTEDKNVNLQEERNLEKDTNLIYSNIDKFQNSEIQMSKIQEAVKFMEKIGKNPQEVFTARTYDLSWLPDNFQDLAKMGKELYNDYINWENAKRSESIAKMNKINEAKNNSETVQQKSEKEVKGDNNAE